jgi:hypothetical protein
MRHRSWRHSSLELLRPSLIVQGTSTSRKILRQPLASSARRKRALGPRTRDVELSNRSQCVSLGKRLQVGSEAEMAETAPHVGRASFGSHGS